MRRIWRYVSIVALLITLLLASGAAHAGAPLGPARFLIRNVDLESAENSALAYNSHLREYLVVWENAGKGTEIFGQRISKNGELIGSTIRISSSGDDTQPDVAYNSAANEYLIVWKTGLDIRGQRITALGALQGGWFELAGGLPLLHSYEQPAVAYASAADRYLVVYGYRRVLDGSSGIWAQSLLNDGGLDGDSFRLSSQSVIEQAAQPDVAYNPSRNELLVVWQQNTAGDLDIYGRRVTMAGGADVVGDRFPISNEASADEIAAAVAAIPTTPNEGQYLVVWQNDTSGTVRDILARTVSGAGALGVRRTVADSPWSEYRPAVAGSERHHQFLVTWIWVPVITPPAVMQVQARTLALDGTPLHDTVLVGGGQVFDSAVAAGPAGDFLVAFDDNAVFGVSNRGIYGRLWGTRVFLPLALR